MQKNENEPLYFKIDGWKYHHTGEWDVLAGPMTEMEFLKQAGKAPKGNFSITREKNLIESIRCLKSKTGILFAYLLDNRDTNNQLLYKPKKISMNTGISERGVIENLKYFEQHEIIARDDETIMVHPGIVHRGNRLRENHLLDVFNDMKKAWRDGTTKKEETEKKENVV